MGMTYEELSVYGRLRKIFRCGPVSMFQVGLTVTCSESQSVYYIYELCHQPPDIIRLILCGSFMCDNKIKRNSNITWKHHLNLCMER